MRHLLRQSKKTAQAQEKLENEVKVLYDYHEVMPEILINKPECCDADASAETMSRCGHAAMLGCRIETKMV